MTASKTNERDWAEEIGEPAYASIVEMVAALECDYDRLNELREERDELMEVFREETRNAEWNDSMFEFGEELKELEEAAGECKDREEAEQRIQEDALSVEMRSDWTTPGEPMAAGEFKILLTWGGPAVQIMGDLDEHGEPCRARLEVQDWWKPWTEYVPASQDTLLAYARCFCFAS